jgi:hypothetical protein
LLAIENKEKEKFNKKQAKEISKNKYKIKKNDKRS